MPEVLQLECVTKRFHPGPVEAVRDFTLAAREGEILTLLGPSGCGKTTALRLLAGFEMPDEGVIRVSGRTVAGDGAWVPPERRGIGMVFQDYALFPHLTVADNVMFGLRGRKRRERRVRAREVLESVGLAHTVNRYPHELSGGQQQRVALARALAPEPVMILMDEPFSNLDAHLRDSIRDEVVGTLRAAGVTCVLVSHDQRDALAVSDRVAVMNRGRIEQVGTPREIYKHPESVFVATFVGRTNLLQGVVQGPEGCVLTDFGSFCRVDRVGLPEGTGVMVAVRPDGFQAAEHGVLRGTVLSTTYTGAQVEAEVGVPTREGGTRRLVVHLPPGQGYREGDDVAFRIVPEFASIVRNACETLGFAEVPARSPTSGLPAPGSPTSGTGSARGSGAGDAGRSGAASRGGVGLRREIPDRPPVDAPSSASVPSGPT